MREADNPPLCEQNSSSQLKSLIEKDWSPQGRGNSASRQSSDLNCNSTPSLQPAGQPYRFLKVNLSVFIHLIDFVSPWTARRSNESILKEIIWKDWCWSSNTWPPDAKSRLIGKDPDAGKDWGQKKVGTEDEMVGWHHRFNGHEFEETLEDSEG